MSPEGSPASTGPAAETRAMFESEGSPSPLRQAIRATASLSWWPTVSLAVVWAAVLGWLGWRLAGRAPDDMFITYRYAWNLAHGEGFVFNPGERVFGLTNPGLGLLLGVLSWLTRAPVHLVATVVFGLSLWCLSLVVWSEGRREGGWFEALVGGTLVVASTYVWVNQGSAGVTVLALLAGSAALAERWPVTAGVLAGAAVWCRPDAGLGVLALGLLLWLGGRRLPWRWGLAAAGTIGIGLLAAWLWFGTPLPQTFEAKRIMASSQQAPWTGPTRFWARPVLYFRRHWGVAWLLVAGMGVAGLWPLFVRGGRAVRTIALYGAAVAVAYPLLGVPFFAWYVVPPVVAALYGVAALAAGVGRGLEEALPFRRRRSAVIALAVTLLLLAAPVASVGRGSRRWLSRVNGGGRYATLKATGLWLREHALPEERVAYGEVGNLAYWSERPMEDLTGLVTPAMLPYVAANDQNGAFLALAPDLFVFHPETPQPGIERQRWFRRAYEAVAEIEPPPGGHGTATVYRRRPGASLPEPGPPRERRPERSP